MSGFASRLQMSSFLNRSSYAGPRRLILIGGIGALMVGSIVAVSLTGSKEPPKSSTARMPFINPLPGGLNGNAQQSKLALVTNQEQADAAAREGRSWTPPISASVSQKPPTWSPPALKPTPSVVPTPTPAQAFQAAALSNTAPHVVTPRVVFAPDPAIHTVAQTTQVDPNQQAKLDQYVNRMLRGWDGRSPVTDVILPLRVAGGAEDSGDQGAAGTTSEPRNASYATRSGGYDAGGTAGGQILIPAGRGIFAHTILAASTDSEGPIVLQADSGPLAGDRMIGTFGKASANGGTAADRMIVRVISVEHQGRTISVDAIVTAPDTMETTVASSVDEHYISRFLLPAAAAFVQGLGVALETTSNTTSVASELGGVTAFTHLNLPQQLGVAAGSAASQVGNTLNQQAPRGPTVHLDANANVGVMFLAPVIDTAGR